MSRHYTAHSTLVTQEIECTQPGAAWNDPSNQVTVTTYFGTGNVSAGRIQSVLNPDRTATVYSYSQDPNTQTETDVVSSGVPNVGVTAITDGTCTATVATAAGYVLSQTQQDIASGLLLSSKTTVDEDAFGRPSAFLYDDGSQESLTESCCGPATQTDRTGSVTAFAYDDLGRKNLQSQGGVTLLSTFDPQGNLLETDRKGSDDSVMVLTTAQYDLAGRIILATQPPVNGGGVRRGTSTAQSYDGSGHLIRTTTNPDGGTQIETFFQDGTPLSVVGTAVRPVRYVYGIQDVTRNGVTLHCTTTTAICLDGAGADTAEWTASYADMQGHTVRTVSLREVAAGGTAETDSIYNGLGQLVSATDPDGVATLYAYDAKGEQTVQAIDVNGNGVIDYAGTDQITKATRTVTSGAGGATVQRTSVQQWQTNGADAPVTISVEDTTPNGRQRWSTRFGLASVTNTSWSGGGEVDSTATYPDGSTASQTSQDGRVMSTARRFSDGSVVLQQTSAYDPHNRLHSVTDLRNRATTYAYFSDDTVSSVTTPQADAQTSGGRES